MGPIRDLTAPPLTMIGMLGLARGGAWCRLGIATLVARIPG
jgi:hypothetical protein